MATYTTYYQLTKPQGADLYNIQDFNGNADIIDGRMHTNAMNIEYTQDMIAAVIDDPSVQVQYLKGKKYVVGNNLYVVTTTYSGVWNASYAQSFVLGDYITIEEIIDKFTESANIEIYENDCYKKSGIVSLYMHILCLNDTSLTPNAWNTVATIAYSGNFGYKPIGETYGNSRSGSKVRITGGVQGWEIQINPTTATTEEYISIMYMTED